MAHLRCPRCGTDQQASVAVLERGGLPCVSCRLVLRLSGDGSTPLTVAEPAAREPHRGASSLVRFTFIGLAVGIVASGFAVRAVTLADTDLAATARSLAFLERLALGCFFLLLSQAFDRR